LPKFEAFRLRNETAQISSVIRHFLVHPKSSACFGRPAYACWRTQR
jgi:hypothetical protein